MNILLVGLFVAASGLPKSVAVMPLKGKNLGNAQLASVVDDLLLSELQQGAPSLRIVGQTDIDAVLGLDKKKSALGCDSASCLAEIGGALGVDSVMYGSLARLGKAHVLSLSWVKQRDASVIARVSESLGESEDGLLQAVRKVVATMVGKTPAVVDAAPSTTAVAALSDLSNWETMNGTWYANEGVFYGSGGHVIYKGRTPTNYRFAVTVDLVSGEPSSTMAVGVRSILVPGKTLRNGTMDLQCYGFNFAYTGMWSAFRGFGGNWYRLNDKEWPTAPELKGKVRVEWRVKGSDLRVLVGGKEFFKATDGSLAFGPPMLAAHHANAVYAFSQIELEALPQ